MVRTSQVLGVHRLRRENRRCGARTGPDMIPTRAVLSITGVYGQYLSCLQVGGMLPTCRLYMPELDLLRASQGTGRLG